VNSRWPSYARRALALGIGAGSVAYLGNVLWASRVELAHALDIDSKLLAILFLLMLGSHVQRTLEVNYVLYRLRVREPFVDGFLLNGAALLLNYLPLSAGSVARAVVLRRKYSLSYVQYVSALMVASIMNAEVAAVCGGIAALSLARTPEAAAPVAAFFGTVAVAGAIALSLPGSWMPTGEGTLQRQLRRLVDGVTLIRDGGAGLLPLAASSAAKLTLNTLRLWVCFDALGQDMSLMAAVLLGATAITASLVNVVPGNIGVRELVLGAVSGLVGGSPVLGMAAASLERAVTLAYTILAGLPGVYYARRIERLSRKSVSH
jgi:uncharacterized membrane protein YbhN (UPF0104 family)